MYPVKQFNHGKADYGNDPGYENTNEDLGKIPCQETNYTDDQDNEKEFVLLVERGHVLPVVSKLYFSQGYKDNQVL
jgi:hypothetical protein